MIICTDGSCKRNGKPDCVSSYGIVIMDNEGKRLETEVGGEYNSTSQRGELLGMLTALMRGLKAPPGESVFIVTDSAYIANCINGRWYEKWERNGWQTSEDNDVKNKDLWKLMIPYIRSYSTDTLFVYLIKGHLNKKKIGIIEEGLVKFAENNNGVTPPREIFEIMIDGNNIADELAKCEASRLDALK